MAIVVVSHIWRIDDLACFYLLDHVNVDLLFLDGLELFGKSDRFFRAASGERLLDREGEAAALFVSQQLSVGSLAVAFRVADEMLGGHALSDRDVAVGMQEGLSGDHIILIL